MSIKQKEAITESISEYEEKGVAVYIYKYNKETLYSSLIAYHGEDLRILTEEQRKDKIDNIPDVVLSAIIKEYKKFIDILNAVCTGDEIDENFLENGSTS